MIRRQTETNKNIKQNERKQKKQYIIDEDIDLVRFFEFASSDKKYVNDLNLHANKNEILEDYTGGFEMIGSMLFGEIEQKQILGSKMLMISKPIITL